MPKNKKTTLPKSLTTVTPFSKALAAALFIMLPFIAFSFGMKYERILLKEHELIRSLKENKTHFSCDSEKSVTAIFYPKADTHVDLKLSDGRKLSLARTMSASGARYASDDESTVFWNKGNTAFLTENSKDTFVNCVEEEKAY